MKLQFIGLVMVALVSSPAFAAGVFSTPHLVAPGEFAIGVEPEIVLTNGAGVGFNGRFTMGLTDSNNTSFIIGTGSGPRDFRFGGNFTFDFFPDIEGQPGMGVAVQGMYYHLRDTGGQLEATATPYIHKSFKNGDGHIEPFIGVPLGWAFSGGKYQFISTFAMGTQFKTSDKISFILELGVAISHTDSYFSGGLVYYH